MEDIRTLMLTTDFSDTSIRAVAPAVTLARRFGARILVAYVEEDRLPPMVIEYMAVGVEDLRREQHQRAERQLEEFVRAHLPAELGVERAVVLGTPHVEIARLAEARGVDLIVMATHGRGFISHAILGSTTERVVRRAGCPVLVVRASEEA